MAEVKTGVPQQLHEGLDAVGAGHREIEGDASALASGVIIPRKGLGELKRLVDEDDAEEIELAFANNSGLARKGDVTLVMRLIEGEFPNYNQVIPKDLTRHLILPTDSLVW